MSCFSLIVTTAASGLAGVSRFGRRNPASVCLACALALLGGQMLYAAGGGSLASGRASAVALWLAMLAIVIAAGCLHWPRRSRKAADGADSHAMAVQIAEQRVEIDRMSFDLAEARQAQTGFLTNLSHEIRQPLTAILGFAEMLTDPEEIAESREIAGTIRRNTTNLIELLGDVLDLANLESGKMRLEIGPCCPRQLLEEVVMLMEPMADSHVKLRVEYDGLLPEVVSTDVSRLRQTLINIVSNAIRFTEQGSVTIRPRIATLSGGRRGLEIAVADTGIGMSEEMLQRLFEPFSTATGRAQRYKGSGLGLTICRRLVQLLQGEILVESTPNQGSCFTVRIPIGSLENVRLTEPLQQPLPSARRAGGTTLHCRVLVVDDSLDNRRLISFVLKKAGARVDLADDGAQGVAEVLSAEAAGEPYDLVLMDMQMPVLDGFEATAHLRSVGFARPIVALTALALGGDRQRCLEAGCDDYITKPIDREALLQTVADFAHEIELAASAP